MADEDPVRKLARAGRKLAAEDRARAQRLRDAEAASAGRELAVQIRNSVSAFANGGWWMCGGALGIGAVFLVFRWLPESEIAGVIELVVAGVPAAVCALLRPTIGARGVAREQAWLRGLPFRVSGYLEAIGSPRTEGTAAIVLVFQRFDETITPDPTGSFRTPGAHHAPAGTSAPDDETLGAVFRTVGGTLEASRELAARRITYRVSYESSPSSNAHLVRWLHRALAVVEALHARHAILEVRIQGFD